MPRTRAATGQRLIARTASFQAACEQKRAGVELARDLQLDSFGTEVVACSGLLKNTTSSFSSQV
jgi:hypothetical protein